AYACSIYIATGATIGLFMLFPQVNTLLFTDSSGTSALRVLVLAIILSSSAITLIAILQGAGKTIETALAIGCMCMIKWFLNMWLVPLWGITGSAWASVGSVSIVCVYLLLRMRKTYGTIVKIPIVKLRGLLFASLLMGAFLYVTQIGFSLISSPSRWMHLLYITCAVSIGGY